MDKIDKKNYKILKELDRDFRQPFSKIAKKVGLSKNSTALRFEKLKYLMLHNITGINYQNLGYFMVKVFYSLSKYNEEIENHIIKEVKKNKNILFAAKLFGNYDLEICLLIKNINQLTSQIDNLNKKLLKNITRKDVLIIEKEFYKGYDFLYENISRIQKLERNTKIISLTKIERRILPIIRAFPRASITEISIKTKLNPKTIIRNLKKLLKNKIILGYFLSLDLSKFNFEVYKLLIQIQNLENIGEFENYLCSIKNTKHISKILSLWDYELDIYSENLQQIQERIDNLKNKFPKIIRNITIISHGKRIITNKEGFLED